MAKRSTYAVVVGNVGTVYSGGAVQAKKEYNSYKEISKGAMGRGAGETVTLFCDGEPEKEYDPNTTNDKIDRFVLINDDQQALAVYGAALETQARAKAAELLQQFAFGVRLVVTHMRRPRIRENIPDACIVKEVLLFLEGQDPKSPVHPNVLGRLRKSGQWAAYENQAFDSVRLGHLKYLKYGEECTFKTPPRPRLPDTNTDINWGYQYKGRVDVRTGLLLEDVPADE